MVWCTGCMRNVTASRPFDGALACNICGKVLEDFNYSSDPTFIKNAAGQRQLSGNIVKTRQSQISSSRERTLRRSSDEIMSTKNVIGIGDQRDDLVDMANRLYGIAAEWNFTRGRISEQEQRDDLVDMANRLYGMAVERNFTRGRRSEQEEAAKEAIKAKYANCAPDDLEAAQKLAEVTAAPVTKSRKEKQKKGAEAAKNAAPPQTAAEATRQMLSKKNKIQKGESPLSDSDDAKEMDNDLGNEEEYNGEYADADEAYPNYTYYEDMGEDYEYEEIYYYDEF